MHWTRCWGQRLGKSPSYSAGNHILLRDINVTLLRPQHRANRLIAPAPQDSKFSSPWLCPGPQTQPVWVRKAKPIGNTGSAIIVLIFSFAKAAKLKCITLEPCERTCSVNAFKGHLNNSNQEKNNQEKMLILVQGQVLNTCGN